MQQLHLVTLDEDLSALVFSGRRGAKTGAYRLNLSPELCDALEEAISTWRKSRPNRDRPTDRVEPSAVTPRDIQTQLRAGRSVDEIAADSDLDSSWVERFAAPIRAEQERVLEKAHDLSLELRSCLSGLPLGKAARRVLLSRGIELNDGEYRDAWRVTMIDRASWLVRLSFMQRSRVQEADWQLELHHNELFPLNKLATELGWVDERGRPADPTPRAPRVPNVVPQVSVPKKAAIKKAATKKAATKNVAASKQAKN